MVFGAEARGDGPIRLLPENGHYFEFRGKPVVLMGSTEHYGSLFNLDFDYIRYLDEVKASGLNLVRVFSGSYRQYPNFVVEDSPLNPQFGRFQGPWARSDVPGESDGGNKFDLTTWNEAYFHRLRDFVRAADERDIVVELTLFCTFYNRAELWAVSPMNAANHINGVGAGGYAACFQVNSDLLPFHKALTRKCAEELKDCENVFFEITNEPYFGPVPMNWQVAIIDELVAAEAALPRPHLIALNIANFRSVITNPHPAVSIFNFHYAHVDAALLNQGLNRAIGDDETGFTQHPTTGAITLVGTQDFPYRREAWEFMLSGGGLMDHLDYSFTPPRPDGLASPKREGGGGPAIRRQLGLLRWFLEELPLARCAPQSGFVTGGVPAGGGVSVLGSPGEAYGIYLRGGSQANLVVNLPAGTYRGRWIDPRSGTVSANVAEFTHGGGSRTLASPAYGEDVALMIFGGSLPPPEVRLTSPVYQTVAAADSSITLTAEAQLVNGTLTGVEFLDGSEVLGMDTVPPFTLTLDTMKKGSHVFRARAVASDGRQAFSPPVKCILMGSYHAGVNLNGPEVSLNGQLWTSNADALASGMVLTNTQVATTDPVLPLYPAPDSPTQSLVSSQVLRLNDTNNPELAVDYPVSNGTYDVFFSLVEGQAAYSRDMRVLIEGEIVAREIGDMALGEWVNYGPYRSTVTDGTLSLGFLRDTKGSPKIANFSVYQAQSTTPLEEARLDIRSDARMAVLSFPSSVPGSQLETSIDPGDAAAWQPLNLPSASFTDTKEIAVPLANPRRFFRIRKD